MLCAPTVSLIHYKPPSEFSEPLLLSDKSPSELSEPLLLSDKRPSELSESLLLTDESPSDCSDLPLTHYERAADCSATLSLSQDDHGDLIFSENNQSICPVIFPVILQDFCL